VYDDQPGNGRLLAGNPPFAADRGKNGGVHPEREHAPIDPQHRLKDRSRALSSWPPSLPARGPRNDLRVFLDTFGKPRREVVCACERPTTATSPGACADHGSEVNQKIASPRGGVQQFSPRASRSRKSSRTLPGRLSRQPTTQEQTAAAALIQAENRPRRHQRPLWSLLNSREFRLHPLIRTESEPEDAKTRAGWMEPQMNPD